MPHFGAQVDRNSLGKGLHLKLVRNMHARNGLHQVGCGVVSKVGADITNTQTTSTGLQVLGMLKGRLVKSVNLLKETFV